MNNNIGLKESVGLLNGTGSDSESASENHFTITVPQTVQTRRKILTKRRSKSNTNLREGGLSAVPCSLINVVKTASIVFSLGGTFILGWLVLSLHSEINQLSEKLLSNTLSNGQDFLLDVNRELQEVRRNQTDIQNVLKDFSASFSEVLSQNTAVKTDLQEIKNGLKEAPQMMNIGKELDSLKTSLAAFEAKISDLKLSVDNTQEKSRLYSELQRDLEAVNATLQGKVQWAIEDLHHHHEMITNLEQSFQNMTVNGTLSTVQQLEKKVANMSSHVDALQKMVFSIENQQRNVSLTLNYLRSLLQSYDSMLPNLTSNHTT